MRPKGSGVTHLAIGEPLVSDILHLPDLPTRRPADRKCLCCGTVFPSSWAGHRMCDPCRARGGPLVND